MVGLEPALSLFLCFALRVCGAVLKAQEENTKSCQNTTDIQQTTLKDHKGTGKPGVRTPKIPQNEHSTQRKVLQKLVRSSQSYVGSRSFPCFPWQLLLPMQGLPTQGRYAKLEARVLKDVVFPQGIFLFLGFFAA